MSAHCGLPDCTLDRPHGHGTDVVFDLHSSSSRKEVEEAIDALEFCSNKDCGHLEKDHCSPGRPLFSSLGDYACAWGGCLCEKFKPREEPRGLFFDDVLLAAFDAGERRGKWREAMLHHPGAIAPEPADYERWRERLADRP